MIKCEKCIMPKLLKCTNVEMCGKLDDAFIENGNLKADIDILREDLREAYDAIVFIMQYECTCYGNPDLYEKARKYLDKCYKEENE